MKKLFEIKEADVLTAGLFPALPDNQLALWRSGENILFYDGRVEKLGGISHEATSAPVLTLAQASVAGVPRIYSATATEVFKWEAAVQTSLGSGFSAGNWGLEVFGSFLLATNDIERLQVWKNTGSLVNLANTNFLRAKVVRKLENHVLVFNTDNDSQEVRWCSKSDIETWVANTANSAGGITVRDLDSSIQAAEPFGNALGFYTSNAFGLVEYVGPPFWFSVKKQLQGLGALSKDSIVSVTNEQYGFGPEGIFRNNGVSFIYVDTPAIKRWIKDNLDLTETFTVRGVHYQAKGLVLWSFKCKDGLRRGVGFNYTNGAWTILLGQFMSFDEPVLVVAGEDAGRPVVGKTTGWGFFDTDGSFSDATLPSKLRTNAQDAGENTRWKKWDMLRLELEREGDLEIRFGFGEQPGEPDYWSAWAPIERENWIGQESIYLTVELRSLGTAVAWALTGIEVYGVVTAQDR